MTDDLSIKFGTDLGGLSAGVGQVRGLLEQVTAPINNMKEELLELGEVFAATFAIEEIASFIEEISAMGEQIEHLTHQLGMSAEAVTGMQSVMRQMGGSAEDGTSGLTRLDRSIGEAIAKAGTARDNFAGLGISMQDLKSLTPEQILMKMADRFHDTADGAIKTDYALQLMGRGAGAWIATLDKGSTGLQEMIDKGIDLHTVFGDQIVADMDDTAEHINLLKEATLGLSIDGFEKVKSSADLLIESLSQLVEKLGDAENKAPILAVALKTIGAALAIVAELVAATIGMLAEMWDLGEGIYNYFVGATVGLIQAAYHALTGNWAAVEQDFASTSNKIKDNFTQTLGRMKQEGQDFHDWAKHLWDPFFAANAGAGPETKSSVQSKRNLASPTDHSVTDKAAKERERIDADYYKNLEQLRQLDLAAETADLDQKVQTGALTDTKRYDLLLDYYAKKHKEDMNDLTREAAGNISNAVAHAQTLNKKLIAEEQYNNQVQTLQFARQRAAEQLSAMEQESVRTAASLRDLDTAGVEASLNQEVSLGHITEQRKIAILLDYYARKHAADMADMQAEASRNEENVLAHKATLDKMLLSEKAYSNQVQSLQMQMANAQIAWVNRGMSPFFQGLNTMLTGSGKFRDVWIGIINDLTTKFVNLVERFVEQWLAGELTRTAATVAGEAARTTAKEAGATAGLAIQAETGLKEIFNNAYKAAAGAYSAVAGIPYIGPILAPIAAATAFAAVAAFGTLASARDGWGQVPHDQLAMIHENEMVLPAPIAGLVRSMANGFTSASQPFSSGASQQGGSQQGGDTHNWYISAIDAKSVKRLFQGNPAAFAAGAQSAAQHLKITKAFSS